MGRLDGGQIVIRSLKDHGVSHLFSLGGGHINPTWWEAERAGLRRIDVRHEAAALYAAEGWALATGELGVGMVTAGPGVTNALTGLATAYHDGVPVLCLAGAATTRGEDTGEVESLEQLELVRPVTKWARRVHHLERLPEQLAVAITEARSGRPGPTYLEVPIDLIHSSVDEEALRWPEPRRPLVPPTMPPPELIERAAQAIASAERPAVVAGSGVWWSGAGAELRALVEHASLPLVTRRAARGLLPDDHPLCFGQHWASVVYQADVLLVVGTQLDYFFGYGRFPHLRQLVQLDIHPGELGRNGAPVTVPLLGDAGATLAALAEALDPLDTKAWVAALSAQAEARALGRAELAAADRVPIHPLRVCAEIEAVAGRQANVVTDGSNMLMWTDVGLGAYEPGRHASLGPLGTIGHGAGLALGMACARPDGPTVWAVGDGSFGFHCMELDTAARHGLPVTAVIFNNGGWSAAWIPLGERHYERMAPAFDGVGECVERPDQLRPALERAIGSGGPAIVNVFVDPAPPYFAGRRFRWEEDMPTPS